MQKDSFLRGTLVTSFFVIFSKILGFIYNIPFRAIVGESGGVLYSYAYTTYEIFLVISTVGIPLAISKITSEYGTLGFLKTQKKVFYIARNIVVMLSFIVTIVFFFLAPIISEFMVGNIKGSKYSATDVTFVLRVASMALVFVAIIGNMRGFLQGNRYISVSSSSQLVEQFIRVLVILTGCYLAKKFFGFQIVYVVAIAVFGATAGAIASAFYLKHKISKEKVLKFENYKISNEEKSISKKYLIKKIITTTFPFVIVSLADSSYGFVNALTVVRGLTEFCGFSVNEAEKTLGFITTWGLSLNAIVASITSGIYVSILPNITKDLVSCDLKEVKKKINKVFQLIIIITIPAATGLSLLSGPVLNAFYGVSSGIEPLIFSFSIFVSIFSIFELNVTVIMQSLNKFKTTYIASITGLAVNAILNIPFMILFDKLNIRAYNGASFSTIIGLLVAIFINIKNLKKTYKINFERTIKEFFISLSATFAMIFLILILKNIIPFETQDRLGSVFTIAIFTILGGSIYLTIMLKTKCIQRVLGKNAVKKISSKFRKVIK